FRPKASAFLTPNDIRRRPAFLARKPACSPRRGSFCCPPARPRGPTHRQIPGIVGCVAKIVQAVDSLPESHQRGPRAGSFAPPNCYRLVPPRSCPARVAVAHLSELYPPHPATVSALLPDCLL